MKHTFKIEYNILISFEVPVPEENTSKVKNKFKQYDALLSRFKLIKKNNIIREINNTFKNEITQTSKTLILDVVFDFNKGHYI